AELVQVRRGDLLIVRTGHMSRYLDRNDWRHFDLDDSPGVSVHAAPWMHAKEIAAIAADNYAVEVRPSELAPFRSPFHICAIPNMGLTLGEIFFLEELAADCAADGRYEFLLVAPPLPVTRALGTPINPSAIKGGEWGGADPRNRRESLRAPAARRAVGQHPRHHQGLRAGHRARARRRRRRGRGLHLHGRRRRRRRPRPGRARPGAAPGRARRRSDREP